jgi:hypothetical protein
LGFFSGTPNRMTLRRPFLTSGSMKPGSVSTPQRCWFGMPLSGELHCSSSEMNTAKSAAASLASVAVEE